MGDVCCLPKGKISPDAILEMAKGNLDAVAVIGWNEDDDLWMTTSYSKYRDVLWLLEQAKIEILNG